MSSRRHGRGKEKKESRGVPTQWSEWEWSATRNCWACYRLDAHGKYEYRYDDPQNTNTATQFSTGYPSSSEPASQTFFEDLNAQCQGLDLGTGHERGRKESREDLRPDQPRDPSIDPDMPIREGPKPKPKPKPAPASQHQNSSSTYDSSAEYYGSSPKSSTFATSTPYPSIPAAQYVSTNVGEYDHRSHEQGTSQDHDPNEVKIEIQKKSFVATISSSPDSFISSKTVDDLRLKKDRIKPWTYRPPHSKEKFEIREMINIDIEQMGGAKLEDVQLYVLSRRCHLKHPVVLGTDVSLGTANSAPPDYLSSRSIDSGYGTASSRRPSFNQPSMAHTSATYLAGQPSYSSPSPTYHQPQYAQNLPSVQETPSSSYPTSSYPTQVGRTMSHGTSGSYYTPNDESQAGSGHESYAAQTSTQDRTQHSGFSSYDSGAHSGTTGGTRSGDGGMGYDFPPDDDNYYLHSDSHATHSAYNPPRTVAVSDEPQHVYSSASDDVAYATDYVTR